MATTKNEPKPCFNCSKGIFKGCNDVFCDGYNRKPDRKSTNKSTDKTNDSKLQEE